MKRFSINDIILLPGIVSYRNQVALYTSHLEGLRQMTGMPFAIDAFVVEYVISGTCISEVNGNTYELTQGETFIMSPTHTFRLISPSADFCLKMLVINTDNKSTATYLNYLVNSERWTHSFFNPAIKLNNADFCLMNRCLDRIEEQIGRTDTLNKDNMVNLAIEWHNVELDNIMRKHFEEWKSTGQKPSRYKAVAQEMLLLIAKNYRTEHQVSFYAGKMCLTPQYLNQISGKVLGTTVSSIISSLLYSTARSMIVSTDMSIQEIASELKFADQASFSKFFKKMSGNSPASIRKNQSN